MPAGIKYELKPDAPLHEFCSVETIYRMIGGFNLVTGNLEKGSFIPPMAPLAVDFAARTATPVKNIKVVEDAATSATELKIAKGSQAYVGMIVGTGTKGATIASIVKSSTDYDVITLGAALGEAVSSGAILFEASSAAGTAVKNKANFLNYTFTKVEDGATVTAVGKAFEIRESKLIAPISNKDKEALKGVYIFTL